MPGVRSVSEVKKVRDKNGELVVPKGLIDAIAEGSCVAFVGAGFSAAARLPGWQALLNGILKEGVEAGKIPAEKKGQIQELIDKGSSSSLDTAAQIMEDYDAPVGKVAQKMLKVPEPVPEQMMRRLKLLSGIPFSAVLTTNFDGFLPGPPAAHADARAEMQKILRDPALDLVSQLQVQMQQASEMAEKGGEGNTFKQMIDEVFAPFVEELADEGEEGEEPDEEIEMLEHTMRTVPCIQLHGTVASDQYLEKPGLAFTRRGYRNLLHGDAAYQQFLKSVMSSKTILYMGFSFSDEYINEMRSEIMMMLEQSGEAQTKPLAYAVMFNQSDMTVDFYQKHEGVEILNYVPESGPGFEGLDLWLEAIYQKTSPLYRFTRCLAGKKIGLCAMSETGGCLKFLVQYSEKEFGEDCGTIELFPLPGKDDTVSQEELNTLMQKCGKLDLLVAGYKVNGHPIAKMLLAAVNTLPQERKCPVMVLESANGMHGEDVRLASLAIRRRQESFQMGAAAYANGLKELISGVGDILRKPIYRDDDCSIM